LATISVFNVSRRSGEEAGDWAFIVNELNAAQQISNKSKQFFFIQVSFIKVKNLIFEKSKSR
jgi:hypothetical protein